LPRFISCLLVVILLLSLDTQAQSAPSISSVSLSTAAVGATVTINGCNFRSSQGYSVVTLTFPLRSVGSCLSLQVQVADISCSAVRNSEGLALAAQALQARLGEGRHLRISTKIGGGCDAKGV
jgi:hypothetical protein